MRKREGYVGQGLLWAADYEPGVKEEERNVERGGGKKERENVLSSRRRGKKRSGKTMDSGVTPTNGENAQNRPSWGVVPRQGSTPGGKRGGRHGVKVLG